VHFLVVMGIFGVSELLFWIVNRGHTSHLNDTNANCKRQVSLIQSVIKYIKYFQSVTIINFDLHLLICLKIVLSISHMLTAIHYNRSGDWLLCIVRFPWYNECHVCDCYHGNMNTVPLHKWLEEVSFHKL
jgi:hypothetical protein